MSASDVGGDTAKKSAKNGRGTGRPPGRPSFKPTADERKMVYRMAAVGIPEKDIAMCLRNGVSETTLRKHFKKELKSAHVEANAKIAGRLFAIATQSDDLRAAATAGIFWTKVRMGWSEKIQHVGGKDADDKPIKFEGGMPPVNITIEGAAAASESAKGDDGDS